MTDTLLTQTQAAKAIGISKQAVNHALARGHLSCEQIGPVRFITVSEAERYKTNRPKPGCPKGHKKKSTRIPKSLD